ncbi:unnamed protein product [Arctogadus glacialis]
MGRKQASLQYKSHSRRIQGNTKEWEGPTFALKENDLAHVHKSDVVKKLPQPKKARRNHTERATPHLSL